MARIPLPDAGDPGLEPKAEAMMAAVEGQFGRNFNVIRALSNHPDAMEAFLNLQGVVYTSQRLNPAQTEISYYTAAVANSCHY